MDIAKESVKEIKAFLQEEKAAGNKYVAFEMDTKIITKEQLYPVKTLYEAQEYCYERNTDRDYHTFKPIDAVLKSLEHLNV